MSRAPTGIGADSDELRDLIERNIRNDWQDLDPRSRAIADAYVASFYDYRRTARSLGVPANTIRKALSDPLTRAYVEELRREDSTLALVSKEFVVGRLLDMIPKLAGEEPVPHVLASGEEVNVRRFFPAELRGTLELLGKTVNLTEDEDKTPHVAVQINIGDLIGNPPSVTIKGGKDG